jgi:choline-glycine betaine transporter
MNQAPASIRIRLALAFQGACVAAVGLYAILRMVQSMLFKEPNPATVIWSAHAGYFWRAWTVSYAGVMAGFIAFTAAKQHEDRVCRGLNAALLVAGALILYQGLFVP